MAAIAVVWQEHHLDGALTQLVAIRRLCLAVG